ncbi:MAG: hypothetical protein OXI38_06790, partial [Bacteroidota bacterium]|nr:hypothetical protein [Bacteroidota bacterium]
AFICRTSTRYIPPVCLAHQVQTRAHDATIESIAAVQRIMGGNNCGWEATRHRPDHDLPRNH